MLKFYDNANNFSGIFRPRNKGDFCPHGSGIKVLLFPCRKILKFYWFFFFTIFLKFPKKLSAREFTKNYVIQNVKVNFDFGCRLWNLDVSLKFKVNFFILKWQRLHCDFSKYHIRVFIKSNKVWKKKILIKFSFFPCWKIVETILLFFKINYYNLVKL